MLLPSPKGGLTANRLRNFFAAVAIALSWLFLHPLARDEVNLNVLALLLALSFVTTISYLVQFAALNTLSTGTLFGLSMIAVVSTIVSGGRLTALRDVALIIVTVVLGLSFSAVADRRTVLWGVTVGGILVAAVGWVLSIRRNGLWTGFDYDFVGVTGNGGPEHFSALVGLLGSLALLGGSGWASYAVIFSAFFLGFTLLATEPTIAAITLVTTVLGAMFVKLLRSGSVRFRKALGALAVTSVIIGLVLVFNRRLATGLATQINEFLSVDARYVIWESTLDAFSPWGWLFGHGTFFWAQDSPRRAEAIESMVTAGYRGFSHAHSSYLDLFVAFGLVGTVLLVLLLGRVVILAVKAWSHSADWTDYSLPLLVAFSLGVQTISQSNLVTRPAGWLLCGILVGLLAFSRDRSGATARFLWPTGDSNRRQTD